MVYAVGRDDPARLVVTITPPHPALRATFPPGWGRLGRAAFYRLPPLGGKLASEARLMRGLTVEGRGIFCPRARYFPWMESTQRSSGLRARTRGARLGRAPNLFGADMNLGPLRPPPAAARTYQIHVSPLFPLAPLVCLAFPAPVASFLAPCWARRPIGP